MTEVELDFDGMTPEWIAADSSLLLVASAAGEPVSFLFAADVLTWLSNNDDLAPEEESILALFAPLEDILLLVARDEWAKVAGQARIFRVGRFKTDYSS